jgi:endonuclease YncB( thermonuclease family)
VIDGDTLVVSADGRTHRVRLHGIDAPERTQPWGRQARSALAHKVKGRVVAVDVVDVDRYDRLVGLVRAGGHDVNKEMVQEGHAWVYRQYTWDLSLYLDEMNARSRKAGLWARSDPVAPWDWRQQHGS